MSQTNITSGSGLFQGVQVLPGGSIMLVDGIWERLGRNCIGDCPPAESVSGNRSRMKMAGPKTEPPYDVY